MNVIRGGWYSLTSTSRKTRQAPQGYLLLHRLRVVDRVHVFFSRQPIDGATLPLKRPFLSYHHLHLPPVEERFFPLLRGEVVVVDDGLGREQSQFAAFEGCEVHVGIACFEAGDGDQLAVKGRKRIDDEFDGPTLQRAQNDGIDVDLVLRI